MYSDRGHSVPYCCCYGGVALSTSGLEPYAPMSTVPTHGDGTGQDMRQSEPERLETLASPSESQSMV